MAGRQTREERDANEPEQVFRPFGPPPPRPAPRAGVAFPVEGPSFPVPLPVIDTPAHYPIGGDLKNIPLANYSTSTPGAAGSIGQGNVILAQWSRPDPRRVLITARAFTGPFSGVSPGPPGDIPFAGVSVRLTWGDERGSTSIWRPAPCQQIVTASYVRVEACLNFIPFSRGLLGNVALFPGSTLNIQPQIIASLVDQSEPGFQLIAGATVTEDGEAYANSDPIVSAGFGGACTIASGAKFVGPAIVDSIVFHNDNVASVLMTVADDNGLYAKNVGAYPGIMSVWVPGKTSKEISPGTLQIGCTLFGITGFSSPSEDANDANVYADIFGTILQPGN
jgi:hypothetical protein